MSWHLTVSFRAERFTLLFPSPVNTCPVLLRAASLQCPLQQRWGMALGGRNFPQPRRHGVAAAAAHCTCQSLSSHRLQFRQCRGNFQGKVATGPHLGIEDVVSEMQKCGNAFCELQQSKAEQQHHPKWCSITVKLMMGCVPQWVIDCLVACAGQHHLRLGGRSSSAQVWGSSWEVHHSQPGEAEQQLGRQSITMCTGTCKVVVPQAFRHIVETIPKCDPTFK